MSMLANDDSFDPVSPLQNAQGRFYAHLGGVMAVLSRHLYSGPEVFMREMLQNACDALTARQGCGAAFAGRVDITVTAVQGSLTLGIEDNGIGLTSCEASECLATLGHGFKRHGDWGGRPAMGQFGFGLLSGFLVADKVTLISRSAQDERPAIRWTGSLDGAWSMEELSGNLQPGTLVYLPLRAEHAKRFTPAELRRLALAYGRYLPWPVFFRQGQDCERLNAVAAPWSLGGENAEDQEGRWLAAGEKAFGRPMLGAFHFTSAETQTEGVAFVDSEGAAPGRPAGHILYAGGMLAGEKIPGLAPLFAPFIRCLANTGGLRLNAAREGLHGEERRLERLQMDVAGAFQTWLDRLSGADPARLLRLLSVHRESLLHAVDEHGEFVPLLSDFLTFDTSMGSMSLSAVLYRFSRIEVVESDEDYARLAPLARAAGLCLVRGKDRDVTRLLGALERVLPEGKVAGMAPESFLGRMGAPLKDLDEREQALLATANVELRAEGCTAEFVPGPASADVATLWIEDRGFLSMAPGLDHKGASRLFEDFPSGASLAPNRLLINRAHPLLQHWLRSELLPPEKRRAAMRLIYHLALLGAGVAPVDSEREKLALALIRLTGA